MYIVINGGGKVGSFLARTLSRGGHDVAVIEKRPDVLSRLAEELPPSVLLIEGDGCDLRQQEDAGVGHADVFAAVTGDDDDNLVSCQLAKLSFRVRRAVARVNSPKNEHIFHALGIEAISSTTVIARLIQEEMTAGDILTLFTLRHGQLAFVRVELPADRCVVCDRPLARLELPPETILVSVIRGERIIVPKGDTVLQPGDQVIAVTPVSREDELRRVLAGS